MPMIDNPMKPIERNMDLCPYYSGYEDCERGHFYGPAVRDHFLIHFVLEGKGIFQVGERTWHLQKGQGFLICPGIVTYYKADDEDPWIYTWVGFNGIGAGQYLRRAGLSQEMPVFTLTDGEAIFNTMRSMVETRHIRHTKDLRFTSLLYQLLYQLVEDLGAVNPPSTPGAVREVYIQKALDFIQMNYSREMTIEEMAHYTGIHRKYLSLVFKEVLHIPPQQYLVQYRMNQACSLMKNPLLSISEIAWSVGYKDQFLFSKMFKKAKGMSPRHYRRSLQD